MYNNNNNNQYNQFNINQYKYLSLNPQSSFGSVQALALKTVPAPTNYFYEQSTTSITAILMNMTNVPLLWAESWDDSLESLLLIE